MTARQPCDHDLRVWVDAQTYVALHHLAAMDDRSLSEYVRHLLVNHLRQVSVSVRYLHRDEPGPARDGEGRRP